MIREGILNINKPQNMTSHDVVSAVRKAAGLKRVGHTGTLDPMATGVLPVCLGKSTRIIEYLEPDTKTYRCTMRLGIETDTQDIWGRETRRRAVEVSADAVRRAFSSFSGLIRQTPPMYSALKVKGKKLYEYAREGKTVEVKSREVFIHALSVDEISLAGEEKTVTFTVECSKGTYVRTICRDVGEALGCGGTLSELERVQSGIFSVEDAVDLDWLRTAKPEQIEARLYPCHAPLTHFGKIVTGVESALKFASGQPLPEEKCRIVRMPEFAEKPFPVPFREEYRRAYSVFCEAREAELFLGVAFFDENENYFAADKVFCCAGDIVSGCGAGPAAGAFSSGR